MIVTIIRYEKEKKLLSLTITGTNQIEKERKISQTNDEINVTQAILLRIIQPTKHSKTPIKMNGKLLKL